MRKLLIYLLCGMLAASSSPVLSTPSPTFNEAIIARVDCVTKDGEGIGTAWRIADGRYVTAAHVATMEGTCTVGGLPMSVEVLDNAHDFAIINGPKTGQPLVKISCADFKPDTDYVAIGYAFGNTELTAEPWIAAPFEIDGYRAIVGEAIPGMSGGPVFDYSGRVVGFVDMRWPARSLSMKHTFLCK